MFCYLLENEPNSFTSNSLIHFAKYGIGPLANVTSTLLLLQFEDNRIEFTQKFDCELFKYIPRTQIARYSIEETTLKIHSLKTNKRIVIVVTFLCL